VLLTEQYSEMYDKLLGKRRLSAVFSKISLIILVLLLRLLLDASYVYLAIPYFSWVIKINEFKVVESYFLTCLLALMLSPEVKRPSDFLSGMLFLVPILPSFSIYGLMDKNRVYTYMMALSFVVILILRKLPRIRIPRIKEGPAVGLLLSIWWVMVMLLWFICTIGLPHFYFNLLDMGTLYAFRLSAENLIHKITILPYLAFWTYFVFMNAMIVWAVYRKRFVLVLVLFIIQVILFSFSARRAVLFSPIIVLGTYFISEKRHAFALMVSALITAVAGVSVLALALGEIRPAALLIDRAVFTPAKLNYAYYEFFSDAGFVYMSNTRLSFLTNYPWPYPPEYMVGQYLSGGIPFPASAGFLATSYMHFGFLGMILFAIVVGLLFHLIDSLSVGVTPLRFGVSLVVVPFWLLFTNVDLTAALLTFGIGLSLFLLWLFAAPSCHRIYRRGQRHALEQGFNKREAL
jgi:uncharacterized membrane protein